MNCFQMWPTDVCTSLRGKTEPVGFDNVVYVLRYGDSASDLQVVIMPAKEEIVAKVKNPVLCCGWRLGPGI
jgi:hypothetical protein